MDSRRLARILHRTPGEVAFDRCFFALGAVFASGIVVETLTWLSSQSPEPRSEESLSSGSAGSPWLPGGLFVVGLVIAFLWWRAATSVVRAWRDPSARVLRFSALGLLVPSGWIAVRLMLAPFAK